MYNGLKNLETQKHLKPMFSNYCTEVVEFIHNFGDYRSDPQMFQDFSKYSQISSDLSLQILNDGLAYDDSRTRKFSPSALDTVPENPQSRKFTREKTERSIYVRSSPMDRTSIKYRPDHKKMKKRRNLPSVYQNRALMKIDNDISF